MKHRQNTSKYFSETQTHADGYSGLGREVKKSNRLAMVNKFLVFLIVVFGVSYVASINDLSIKGFVLQELKVSKEKFNDENIAIELKIMDLGSYESISERASELKMVKVDKIDYITVLSETVAKK